MEGKRKRPLVIVENRREEKSQGTSYGDEEAPTVNGNAGNETSQSRSRSRSLTRSPRSKSGDVNQNFASRPRSLSLGPNSQDGFVLSNNNSREIGEATKVLGIPGDVGASETSVVLTSSALKRCSSTRIISVANRIKKCEGLLENDMTLEEQMTFYTENLTYTWSKITATASAPLFRLRNLWREIIDMEPKMERTLNPVSGVAYAGELFAVLGGGGVGKSTLLNILSFRNSSRIHVGGDRCMNGVPVDQRIVQDISGFIHWGEQFFSRVTVKEHLIFNVMLRTKFESSSAYRLSRVNEALKEFGLWKYQNKYIGDPNQGGIPKVARVLLTIAAEAVTNPSIIFCESPAKELDNVHALAVVLALKRFASKGKIVISTFKAPGTEAFLQFDRVCFMTKGRVAFQGKVDEALNFWARLGYSCPVYYNPANYLLSVLVNDPERQDDCNERNERILTAYEKTKAYRKVERIAHLRHWKTVTMARMERKLFKDVSRYRACIYAQLYWLMKREILMLLRSPYPFFGRLLLTCFVAVVCGLVFWDLQWDDDGVRTTVSFFLTSVIFTLVFSCLSMCLSFGLSMKVVESENHRRTYRTVCYYVAKNLVDLPVCTISPCLFVLISFPMVGVGSAMSSKVFYGCITLTLATWVGSSLGYAFTAVSGSAVAALVATHMDILHFVFYSGVLLDTQTSLQAVGFLHNISFQYQIMENLMLSTFVGEDNPPVVPIFDSVVHFYNGENVLDFYNYDKEGCFWCTFLNLLAVCVVIFRVVAFFPFVFRLYLNRKFYHDQQ